jgi:hypothetical protein
MSRQGALIRKSFFVDADSLHRAKKALRVRTDAEAVRRSLDRVTEMDRFWRLMTKTRGTLKPGSFEQP